MAHAGTPTDLARQPAASGSTWKSLLSLIVILAIGIGMVIAVPLITGGKATTAPAVDRGYDQIETQRGATTLSGVTVDTNSAVENSRGAAPLSGTTIDPTTFDRTPRGAHRQLP